MGLFLEVSPLQNLLSHSRFLLTLRSQEGHYHSLILFRLSLGSDFEHTENAKDKTGETRVDDSTSGVLNPSNRQIYIMEASCPHLGADLSHAEIEECETGAVAVCPWHRYDFDLRTGKSETGLKACTYSVEVRLDPKGAVEKVFMETPDGGSDWRVVELRPVSEEFADPPPPVPINISPQVSRNQPDKKRRAQEPVVPETNAPTTLMQWAVLILNTPNPILKVERTRHAVHLFHTGKLTSIGHKSRNVPKPPDIPPREASLKIVEQAQVSSKKKNRAAMLHALASIEQWAVDLAWDIMVRFGPSHPNLPPAFFSDFTKMALDESKHFSLLISRLAAISPSTPYGSMPIHASLWESAAVTSESLRSRLAIIHLVHEARGLDINPAMTARFRKSGDLDTVKVMEVIHTDEVTHVTSGHRWFTWVCAEEGASDPVSAFREEVKKCWRGEVKGPFNVEDREKAGLTPQFYEGLKGGMGQIDVEQRNDDNVAEHGAERLANGMASLKVEYDGQM